MRFVKHVAKALCRFASGLCFGVGVYDAIRFVQTNDFAYAVWLAVQFGLAMVNLTTYEMVSEG